LEELTPAQLRPLARDLDLVLTPTRPENLQRLLRLLELDAPHQDRLAEVLESGVRHAVLNAKKHDEESRIIAGAGALGSVTIATNMAGRGVDIKLGGEVAEEVLAAIHRVLRRSGIADPENLSLEERPRVADEAVQARRSGEDLREARFDRGVVADVHRDPLDPAVAVRPRLATRAEDPPAALEHRRRHRGAEAGRGAGDQDGLAFAQGHLLYESFGAVGPAAS
jgi:hypothetical protein